MRNLTLTVLGVLAVGWALPITASAQRCLPPQVLLSVDKSSSMLGGLATGETKWQAARSAIQEVTTTYSEAIDFGLQVFPYPDRCEPGQVTVDVGPNDAPSIIDALGEPPPTGGNWTPMAQTLDVIAGYAGMADSARDRHVIVITDGWQWCSPYEPGTRFTPVSAVERLRDAGMTVHIVGFGNAVDSLTLNRAAVAAGTALPGCDVELSEPLAMNHCYTQANDLMDLRVALAGIARDITDETCDGIDNDCDGEVDEGFDTDADGFSVCGFDPVLGEPNPGRVDCDDADGAVFPGATETCDGIDNDCDGLVDPGCECLAGAERACGGDVGACMAGTQTCEDGIWAGCSDAVWPAAGEACDGTDEDCDGTVDEDAVCATGEGCFDGACAPLEEPAEPAIPSGEDFLTDPGCQCDAVGGNSSLPASGWAALLLVGAFLVRRRRRS